MFHHAPWKGLGITGKNRVRGGGLLRGGRVPARPRPPGLEPLEDRCLLATTPGTVSGMVTLLNQRDLLKLNVQASVVGGVSRYSGALSFVDTKEGDTFNSATITSVEITPVGTPGAGGSVSSGYYSVAGTATLNGGTTAGYSFQLSGSLPAPGVATSTGLVSFKVGGPEGFSYALPTTAWDPGQTIAVTVTPPVSAPTTTHLTSSVNPSEFGQGVVFTAVVAPATVSASSTPVVGSVRFTVDANPAVSVALVNGKAVYETSSLGVGTHKVVAVFAGSNVFLPSQDTIASQVTNQAKTLTSLSAAGAFVVGQPVSFTARVGVLAPGRGLPTGSVTFLDGTTSLGTAKLGTNSSTVTLSLPAGLGAGAHQISAVYSGDTNFATSTSAILSRNVERVATSTRLTTSVNPAVLGQPVTLTAVVSRPNTSTGAVAPTVAPSGSVDFYDGNAKLGTMALDGTGTAQWTTSFTTGGLHSLTAVYSGDTTFGGSKGALSQSVVTPTTTRLTSSANPSVFGQAVAFTAVVAPAAISSNTTAVNGSVRFTVDSNPPVSVSLVNGKAVYETSSLSVGTHKVVAAYAGTTLYLASQDAIASQVTNQAKTLTSLSAAGTFVVGQPVSFTASVGVLAPGRGLPTGSVTFLDGTTSLGTVNLGPTLASNPATSPNTVTLSLPAGLGAGAHQISAVYSGDANFTTSTSPTLSRTVAQVATATRLTTSVNPVVLGQPTTLTAVVLVPTTNTGATPQVAPSGSVDFYDGNAKLGTTAIDGTGAAQWTTSFTTGGPHSLMAVYSGDATFGSSSGTLSQGVVTPTTTHLTSSANPSVFGQAVVFTAVVTPTPAETNAASVSFTIDTNEPIIVPVGNGRAVYETRSLGVGTHKVVATYGGNILFLSSQDTIAGQVTNQASTVTNLSAAGAFVVGQPVSFTASVGVQAPGKGLPTGSVTFLDGTTSLGTVDLGSTLTSNAATSPSTVTLSLPAGLSAGVHRISAVYSGDTNFATSTSDTLSKTVAKVATATQLSTSVNPVVIGQPVTLTAVVLLSNTTSSGTPAVTPGGMVDFYDGDKKLGTAPLDTKGMAQWTTSFASAGSHALKAVYQGDATFAASSGTLTETVTTGQTTSRVTLTSSANPAVVGRPVTFTVSITTSNSGTTAATGTVTLMEGDTTLGTGAVTNGVATFTITTLGVGSHPITAKYSGTETVTAGTASLTQTVVLPTPGTIKGTGTVLSQQDTLVVDVQSSVSGGVAGYAGSLSFSDKKAGVTFRSAAISSIQIYQSTSTSPTQTGSGTASYFVITGTATRNDGTEASYKFSVTGSLPAAGVANSTGGLTIQVSGPNGFSYALAFTPWDQNPPVSIVVTVTPPATTTAA